MTMMMMTMMMMILLNTSMVTNPLIKIGTKLRIASLHAAWFRVTTIKLKFGYILGDFDLKMMNKMIIGHGVTLVDMIILMTWCSWW